MMKTTFAPWRTGIQTVSDPVKIEGSAKLCKCYFDEKQKGNEHERPNYGSDETSKNSASKGATASKTRIANRHQRLVAQSCKLPDQTAFPFQLTKLNYLYEGRTDRRFLLA